MTYDIQNNAVHNNNIISVFHIMILSLGILFWDLNKQKNTSTLKLTSSATGFPCENSSGPDTRFTMSTKVWGDSTRSRNEKNHLGDWLQNS